MEQTEIQQGKTGRKDLKVIDCDVHPYINTLKSVYPYMPKAWSQRFIRKSAEIGGESRPLKFRHPNGSSIRIDAKPPCGGLAGSDPNFMVDQLLVKNGIESGVLNCLQIGALCTALASVDESIILASAFNDFFAHEWMPVNQGLKFAMSVPSRDPQAAGDEVRRIGKNPQIVAVSLPLLNVPMGDRHYWPIYAAAQELQLPILVHATGPEATYYGAPAPAVGIPDSYAERHSIVPQYGQSSVNSLVFSGTFEKFPHLKFIFVEYGFTWLLPLLWRMDQSWRALRAEVPWVKKSPIEYVHDRCRFTTQPLEEPHDPTHLDKLIEMLGYDQLCFSTDYPHWDNDMPGAVLRRLPEAEKTKIFYDNAVKTLRLS